MLNIGRSSIALIVALLTNTTIIAPVHAQRASEDVVATADDAFGTNIGIESTGIYTEYDTRGFSPLDAGNVRLDGIYYDQLGVLSNRLRASTAIRVGFGAVEFPFVAPTGVADKALRPFPAEAGNSLVLTRYYHGGYIAEWDLRLPLVDDKLALTGGAASALLPESDGAESKTWGVIARPIVKWQGTEFSPFAAISRYTRSDVRPLVVVREGLLPDLPPRRKYLGQKWASGERLEYLYGATLNSRLTDRLSFRGGIFHAIGDSLENYSEIYAVTDADGTSDHFLFADPKHDIHSTSGEALFGLRLGGEGSRLDHRVFGGYRARNRYTETGGSDFVDFGQAIYGEFDRHQKPDFSFADVNRGRVRQSSWMLGYIGKLDNVGHVNIGVQKARYRGTAISGATGVRDVSRANPWLYNATLMVEIGPAISAYLATQRGLEDSGLAPENAANRNERLPPTITRQYEGGVRWDLGDSHLVLSAFEISKPYFSFDGSNNFVALGTRRHRGVEISFAGKLEERLDLLVGAVLMSPEVVGPARKNGLVGKRPAGVPNISVKLDASYRTDLFAGFTLTGAIQYTGKRAVSSQFLTNLDERQLTLPAWTRVDLGIRQPLRLGPIDLSLRAVVRNVFDQKAWEVAAADVLLPGDRRSLLAIIAADF